MKANETRLEEFLSKGDTVFAIPVYQRNYSWEKEHCMQLMNDIFRIGGVRNSPAHFIGSIVYVHDDIYTATGIKELTIIDGQQRLTTVTLLYIALFRLCQEIGDIQQGNKIYKKYLINEFALDNEKLKLKPTDNNDNALKYIMQEEIGDYRGFSKIINNFVYFKSVLNENNYQTVLEGLSKLIFVDIALDRQKDNPQRIFESLNSTGLELSQSDLIRNYILMGLSRDVQDRIYITYWKVIEDLAKEEAKNNSRVSDFFRDFLTLKNKTIPNKNKVYQTFKKSYPTHSEEKLRPVLSELKSLVSFYNKIINPKNEKDKDVRLHLNYLRWLEIDVANPFLMKVYEDFSKKVISKETFISILELIQSFAWRRFIVGFGTEGRNKIFMSLYDKIDQENYLFSIQKELLTLPGNSRFPKDKEVINALKEKNMYNIQSKNRTYFLERLENYDNKEPVEIKENADITIEHIFPKKPSQKWKHDLGTREYNYIQENYLNTIANLTLSGNNGRLSNKSFIEKRDMETAGYKHSRLWLNKYLASLDTWNRENLENRFQFIAERFLKIWKFPNVEIQDFDEDAEINIFDAESPTNRALEYAIFFDKKIETERYSELYVEVFKQLFDAQPETFFTSDIGDKIGLTTDPNSRGAKKISDKYYINTGTSSASKFNRTKQALTLFGFEDELIIKYQSNNTLF